MLLLFICFILMGKSKMPLAKQKAKEMTRICLNIVIYMLSLL